jgi:ribosomal protein S18 acetylase RimI-like enzyme
MSFQIIKLKPDVFEIVSDFFSHIDSEKFHPHSFSETYASYLCNYNGKDLYYVILDDDKVAAYGLLRGWDEGYDIPSLGIYVSSDYRGIGLGKMFMSFLHTVAKNKKSKKVKLKVYKDNIPAIKLYETLGYKLTDYDNNQYIGFIDL